MPQISSEVVTFLAALFAALTQLVKGLIFEEDDELKRWLPVGIVLLCALFGTLLAFYYGRDPVVGVFEGTIAGLTSLGMYASGKVVAPTVVNAKGWLRRS